MNESLKENGHIILEFPYHNELLEFAINSNFYELDQYLLKELSPTGRYFNFFNQFFTISRMEHIISLREAPLDDDGIWHDDGSRHFGFSLSLNRNPETITGGELLFKRKNDNKTLKIGPLPFGTIVIFLSGLYDYEHKVNQVTAGKRLVVAGWGYRE